MKAVSKNTLLFVDGYVVDEEGNVVNNPQLVEQYNEWAEVVAFNKFIEDNKMEIELVGNTVTYEPKPERHAVVLSGPKTPHLDKKQEEALAVWEEVQSKEDVDEINTLLARMDDLLNFINDDTVLLTGEVTSEKFEGDVLALEQKDVVDAYKEYVENKHLRNKVVVKF